MALLITLLLFFVPTQLLAQDLENKTLEILYDRGDPAKSVGIINRILIKMGDFFEGYRVLAFEDNAIVFEDVRTQDSIKFVKQGKVNPEIYRHARHVFVVRQMGAIYEAQTQYLSYFRDHYASSLEDLIHHGFLADGFEDGIKHDYFFEIVETRKEFQREPTFLVIASPHSSITPDLLFSVDQLGIVRYGDTRFHVSWGPAWNYADHTGLDTEFIGVDGEES